MKKRQTAPIDGIFLAEKCREFTLRKYVNSTSCIETSYLFARTAHYLGLETMRVVCQAMAYSPLLAQELNKPEMSPDQIKKLIGQPGYWSVGVGLMQFPGDFVGRSEPQKNRFVGHVTCIAGDTLVDGSADQMSRPEKGLIVPRVLSTTVELPLAKGGKTLLVTTSGAVIQYIFHPEVTVPMPRTDKALDRIARTLAKEFER